MTLVLGRQERQLFMRCPGVQFSCPHIYAMAKRRKDSYPRAIHDQAAWATLSEIEKWSGKIPYELTPLAINNLHKYIVYLEDTVTMLRHRLNQVGAHHQIKEAVCEKPSAKSQLPPSGTD